MGTENQLTVASLGDAVRDNVRKAMFDSIPEEVMDNVIAGEFKKFFEKKRSGYHNDRVEDSEFSKMVKKEITDQLQVLLAQKTREYIRVEVNKTANSDYFNEGFKDVAKVLAPTMMKSFFENVAGQMMGEFDQRLNQIQQRF